jgi:hypothetical protein
VKTPKTFEQWLSGYRELWSRAAAICQKDLGSEIGPLQLDAQQIEPILFDAEVARADAEAYYYDAKRREFDRLLNLGFSKGVALEAAKTYCATELKLRENTRGLCKALYSRSMKVAQHLKLLDGGGH